MLMVKDDCSSLALNSLFLNYARKTTLQTWPSTSRIRCVPRTTRGRLEFAWLAVNGHQTDQASNFLETNIWELIRSSEWTQVHNSKQTPLYIQAFTRSQTLVLHKTTFDGKPWRPLHALWMISTFGGHTISTNSRNSGWPQRGYPRRCCHHRWFCKANRILV